MRNAGFTLQDILSQIHSIEWLGGTLNLIPGAGLRVTKIAESELRRTRAIIQSMTPAERNDPSI